MLLALVLAATTLLASESGLPAPAEPSFRVIVHRANPMSLISRDQLSAVFMKKLTEWSHGVDVVPADRSHDSDIRERFSRAVHGKNTAYVIRYWHRLIFAGRGIPPKEVDSDEAAIEFVRAHRGAISYISRETTLPADVKTIEVTR